MIVFFIKGKNWLKIILAIWVILLSSFSTSSYAGNVFLIGESATSSSSHKRARAVAVNVIITPEASSVKEGGSTKIKISYANLEAGAEYCVVKVDTSVALLGGASQADFKIRTENNASNRDDFFIIDANSDNSVDPNESIQITFTPKVVSGTCTLVSTAPTKIIMKIDDVSGTSTQPVTVSFNKSSLEIKKGAGNTHVAHIKFSLPSGVNADRNCLVDARVNVIGGTASDQDYKTFSELRVFFDHSDGNAKLVDVNLDVLAGKLGTGDKTVEMEAVFSSTGGSGGNSCPLSGDHSKKVTIILKDTKSVAPTKKITISATKKVAKKGETIEVTYSIKDKPASCTVAHPVVAQGTNADPKQYQLNDTVNILNNSTIPVVILEQRDMARKLVIGVKGCDFPVTETITILIEKKADSTTPTPVPIPAPEKPLTNEKEVNNFRKNTCVALRQRTTLTSTQAAYLQAQCGTGTRTAKNYDPEEITVQASVVLSSAARQLQNVRSRLTTLRATKGQRGVDVSKATLSVQGATVSVGLLGGAAGDDENGLLENSRWGFFANGDYAFGDERRGNDNNFDFNSRGLTFGADYRFPGDKKYAGVAIGYKNFDSDFTAQEGGNDLKGYNVSVYGTYLLSDKIYLDATLGYGNNEVDSRRPVNDVTGTKTAFALGKPDANEFTFSVGGGYEFFKREWSLTPYGRMDYIKGTIDAYKETAGKSASQTGLIGFDKQNIEALTSTLGLKASRVFSTSKGVFIPYSLLEWKHEFKDRGSVGGAYLVSPLAKGKLTIEKTTNRFDRNYYNLGVGVSAQLPKGKSAFLSLESRQGDSVVKDNAVKAGFRWEF